MVHKLFKEALDFIYKNELNLYAININPHRDNVCGRKIHLQGEAIENEKTVNTLDMKWHSEDNWYTYENKNISLTLEVDI